MSVGPAERPHYGWSLVGGFGESRLRRPGRIIAFSLWVGSSLGITCVSGSATCLPPRMNLLVSRLPLGLAGRALLP